MSALFLGIRTITGVARQYASIASIGENVRISKGTSEQLEFSTIWQIVVGQPLRGLKAQIFISSRIPSPSIGLILLPDRSMSEGFARRFVLSIIILLKFLINHASQKYSNRYAQSMRV
jgi:hypothetical protein